MVRAGERLWEAAVVGNSAPWPWPWPGRSGLGYRRKVALGGARGGLAPVFNSASIRRCGAGKTAAFVEPERQTRQARRGERRGTAGNGVCGLRCWPHAPSPEKMEFA